MLTIDASGVVEQTNDAVRLLLGDSLPGWLSRAHRRAVSSAASPVVEPVRGPIGDRMFEAHPVHSDGHRVVWLLVDVTGHEQIVEELEWATLMVEASTELLSSLNVDRCLGTTVRLAAQHLADAALVVIPLVRRRYAIVSCCSGGAPARDDRIIDPRSVPGLAEALQGFPPAPARWIDPAQVPEWMVPDGFGDVGSAAVVALPGYGMPAGALVLLRRPGRAEFSAHEEAFVRRFAVRAGSAISVAHLYAEQAAITETLMADLLPPPIPRLEGVEVAARYRPAGDSERVGGDFYEVHAGAGATRQPLVVLGDVAGKGLEAAVITGRVRQTLHALLPLADDHQRILELLNGVLLGRDHTRYVTLVLASISTEGARVALRLTSAGHPPPLIVRNDGRVEVPRTEGTLIGLLESVTSTTDTVLLAPGETCLLYSDGITEAVGGPYGGEFFGDERLSEQLVPCAGMPAEAVVERVQMLATQWVGGGEHDDMAVVAITAPKRSGGHAG